MLLTPLVWLIRLKLFISPSSKESGKISILYYACRLLEVLSELDAESFPR